MTCVLKRKGNQDTDREGGPWKDTGRIGQTMEEGLRRNQSCWHRDLGLPASELWGNTFLFFKSVTFSYGSPRRLMQLIFKHFIFTPCAYSLKY